MSICALIMAAGRGQRTGVSIPKQYWQIRGKPILSYTLTPFLSHPSIDQVRVVIHPEDATLYAQMVAGPGLDPPVMGGASRQESVRLGLESLTQTAPEIVLIHDAARPFADIHIIDAVITALNMADGAIAAIELTDTVKYVKNQYVNNTISREGLWRALTPQAFRYQKILDAHRKMAGRELTDDAAVAEQAGLRVRLVKSSDENFKITTAEDIVRAESKLAGAFMCTRFGQGYDVHRFESGNSVILCGVEIPHDRKLAGHSDADVAMHALTDAILGAIAQGDIGQHFPPSDPQWKGADSARFLEHAGNLVRKLGGELINLDLTIICEAPRIGPHRERMQNNIARILSLPAGRVSVKATTTEGLGFTGRREGIAAQAVASVRVPE